MLLLWKQLLSGDLAWLKLGESEDSFRNNEYAGRFYGVSCKYINKIQVLIHASVFNYFVAPTLLCLSFYHTINIS